MQNTKDYFTTGEFANICGVGKQTLFHYDNIGIFKPAIVGENGYRYYSFSQIETFSVLAALHQLRVPLKDIKEHMNRRSPQALIDLLQSRRQEIDRLIADLQSSKKFIDTKIALTEEGLHASVNQMILEDFPGEYLLITNYEQDGDEKDIARAIGDHLNYRKQLHLPICSAIGGIIPRASVTPQGYAYSKFYSAVDKDELLSNDCHSAVFDAGGQYLSIYDNQGYRNVHSNCQKLLAYASEHQLTPLSDFYEEVILDDLSVQDYDHYLVKLSIKVE
ncbi:MAG: MerR family transcriptional regulator [Firmicutes bacterium]|nr:MerR family transcriptional regulator [Bacillota bacterium]